MNRLVLSAALAERGALRYTPAGLPALDVALKHESEVAQDGPPRKVSLEIKALAVGEVTHALAALQLGAAGLFAGYLASSRNGRLLRFHITAVDLVAPTAPV